VNRVDKARVREAFSRRAGTYDAHARLQREVAAEVARLAAWAAPSPRRALDVGIGTGALALALRERLSAPSLAGVDLALGMARAARERAPGALLAAGDAESLPFADCAFDLVVSSSTFQWLPRLDAAFAEARRVLAPGGRFAFALFGADTLCELKAAWRAALPPGAADRTHRFFSTEEVEAALARGGLSVVRLFRQARVARHADVRALLASLRGIGAGNAAPGPGSGLGARRVTLAMMRIYAELHGDAAGIPATWDVVYGVARRPE